MLARRLEILVVEDNAEHLRWIASAFQASPVPHRLTAVGDGEQALAFLRRAGPYAGAPRPSLILLDLNLPKIDGRTVLAEIKADGQHHAIPVVVFSGSRDAADIPQSYAQHASSYVRKPTDPAQFHAVVWTMRQFWLETVTLPPTD